MRRFAIALILLTAPAGAPRAEQVAWTPIAGEIAELQFGVISTEASSGLKKSFRPFFEDLSAALEMPVRGVFAPDYAGIIEAMRFGQVHLAWFGNKSAIEAVNRANAEVFAMTVDAEGATGYHSLIIVHKDSPLQSVEDMIAHAGELTFGNGDPNSTSGNLIPGYYIWARRGLDPTRIFKRVVASNHEGNLLSVATRQVDVATNNTESLERFHNKRPEFADDVRVIWKSPRIPNDPLVWRRDLPEELRTRIRAFVLAYGRFGPDAVRERDVLAKMSHGWAPFLDSSNRQLLPIRETMLVREQTHIRNHPTMSDVDKRERLEAVNAELADLQRYRELLEQYND